MPHSPTAEQEAILQALRDSQTSIMVNAFSGTGKTSTLELLSKEIPIPALALAFNVLIKKELEARFPANFTIKTFNGLGHSAWGSAIGKRCEVDDRKVGKLVTEIAKAEGLQLSTEAWSGVKSLVDAARQAGLVPSIFPQKGLIPDTPEVWQELNAGLFPECEYPDLARAVLCTSVKLAMQGKIDYDDQIYMSTMFGGSFPRFSLILVDEAQDLSPLNHLMVKKCAGPTGRLIVVGDRKQCHPPGTMITIGEGKTIPIEKLKIGDKVVSYNRKQGFSGLNTHQGVKVTDIQYFDFKGNLIELMAEDGPKNFCTPNHRCLVRWENKQGHCVYLMRKGENYRIGTAQSFYTNGSKGISAFGPLMRARQEEADALWILDVYDSKEEALVQEKIIWTQYGLPDLIFKCSGKASTTQANLDIAWAQVGNNGLRARACLSHFNREYELPLWQKGQGNSPIGERSFVIAACNVISGTMSVLSLSTKQWSKVWLNYHPYEGKVIGLTVTENGYGLNLYVADGMVTHNSIYAFRGADTKSMDKLKELRSEWIELPLTTTFRCAKSIVARQQEHAPGYNAFTSNPEGEILSWWKEGDPSWDWEDVKEAAPQGHIAVLCRNNAPLLSLAFKLIRAGVGCHMRGREIGKGLVALSKKILKDDSTPREACLALVDEWISRETRLAQANGKEPKVAAVTDRGECLLAVLEHPSVDTAGSLRRALESLFAKDTGVTLSTIHKAKGLEWETVVVLDPWRIPSKFAQRAASLGDTRQIEQEYNLQYVAETRAKRTLILANKDDFIEGGE